MAVIATVRTAAEASAALEAGADAVMFQAGSAAMAASAMKEVTGGKVAAGASLPVLAEGDAAVLREVGCDFVVSPLETTDSAAVDTSRMGHVITANEGMEDSVVRALGPLGLDGLYVQRASAPMKLSEQLGLVRLSSFSGTGLVVTVGIDASVPELRVLRDSGAVAVVAPAGVAPEQLRALGDRLREVPAPRKPNQDGRDSAMVPAIGRPAASTEDGDEEDDDD